MIGVQHMDRLSSEMICSRLVQLKEKNDMSYQAIADASNIPLSTVKRIFAGKTDTLGFHMLYDLVTTMGGTMEEFLDIVPAQQGQTVAPAVEKPAEENKAVCSAGNEAEKNEVAQSHAETVRIYQELVLSYKVSLAKNQKWLMRVFIVSVVLMIGIIAILLYDVFTPGIGYIRR